MKKILIVTTVGGFVTQFEKNNLDILNELGYEIHYASNFSNDIYEIDYEALKSRNVIIHDLPIEKSVTKLGSHRKNIRELKRLIEELDINVVHCHTPVGSVIGRMAAHKASNKPYVIYTAHGFHFYKGSPASNKIYYPVERFLAKYTDCLITINQEDFEAAKSFNKKGRLKVVKIPGVGVDVERFRPRPEIREDIRQQLNILDDEFHLVTIGEVNQNKNLDVVIEAIAKINNPRIRYSIFGRGDRMDILNSKIFRLGVEHQVCMQGYCTNTEDILQSADVFVFPSIREGLGMAALEALSCGIPVIAMDNRGTREYIKDGVNGLMCRNNSSVEFADNIRRVLDNKEFDRGEAAKAARATGLEFRIKNTDKIMRKVYGSIKA